MNNTEEAYLPSSNNISWSYAMLLPALVLVVGLAFAIYQDQQIAQTNQQAIANALNSNLDTVKQSIQDRFTQYHYGLRSLRAAVLTNGFDNFDYRKKQIYASVRDSRREYPGAMGFGLVRLVSSTEREQYELRMRADRPDGQFSVRQLDQPQSPLFIIQFIEPERRNKAALGLDIGSEPDRRAAAIAAARTNSFQLTAPLTLVQASGHAEKGFLALLPVYQPRASANSAEPLSGLDGWVYAPLLINDIMATVQGLSDQMILYIDDITDQSQTQRIFSIDVRTPQSNATVQRKISFAGRLWQLSLQPSTQYIEGLNLTNRIRQFLFVLAIATTLAIFVFSLQMLRTRKAMQLQHQHDLAQVQRKALQDANNKLELAILERTQEATQASLYQRYLLQGAGYAIIATTPDGIINVFNPAAEALLGYKAHELLNQLSPAVFHLESEVVARAQQLSQELGRPIEPGFEAFVAKARQGIPDLNRWTYVHKNGHHIPVNLNVTAIIDDHQRLHGFLGIAYDLTAELEREEVLATAREQAELASQAKSLFLANMSHEIRTPLHGIYGMLQILKEQVPIATAQEVISKALYSTRSLMTIINDILDFSKIEAGKLAIDIAPFDLDVVLELLVSEFTPIAKQKGLQFTIKNLASERHWMGDEVRIRQVLLNLTSNAVKFTDHGSVELRVQDSSKGNGLKIDIIDTGIGIPAEKLDRLFDRFEQMDLSTTKKYGGTGLGLAITNSLVTLMGGQIELQSTPGKGSQFTVNLPLEVSSEQQQTIAKTEPTLQDLSGCCILTAEDNEINQVIVDSMLSPTHAELIFVCDGLQAVEQVKQRQPHLILMDIQMPVMDGIAACKSIKQLYPAIPIIALTANAMKDDVEHYLHIGFDDYLAKPFERETLLALIAKHLS